jgi:EAL domain-containing protein (putative c-di-GMP-specific phosphodiesterase class I)
VAALRAERLTAIRPNAKPSSIQRRACLQASRSTQALIGTQFLHDFTTILSDTGVPPARLQLDLDLDLDLVESMAMTGNGITESLLCEPGRRGVSLAVDDLGTGYSSFNYVQTLPASIRRVLSEIMYRSLILCG